MRFFSKTTWAVMAMGASAACFLAGYKVLRSVIDSLFLAEFGASRLPYMMTAVPFGAVLAMYGFSHLLKALGPHGAFRASILLSAVLFLALYAGVLHKVPFSVAGLYLLKEVYIVLLIAQNWSFINSVVTAARGRVLNGPVVGISTLGSLLGGVAVAHLPERFGSAQMIPVGAAFTLVALVFVSLAFRWGGEIRSERQPKSVWDHMAFDTFRKEPTVLWLALLIGATQVISILFELVFLGVLQNTIPQTDVRSAYLVRFWNYQDISALVLTFAVTPLLLSRFKLRTIHFWIPAVHLATACAAWLHPGLATASLAFFLFKTMDYNVFGPAKEILYVPLSFESRYRAKQLIDSVIYRTSKGITSGLISGVSAVVKGMAAAVVYPPVAAVVLLGWFGIVLGLARSNPAMTGTGPRQPDV